MRTYHSQFYISAKVNRGYLEVIVFMNLYVNDNIQNYNGRIDFK